MQNMVATVAAAPARETKRADREWERGGEEIESIELYDKKANEFGTTQSASATIYKYLLFRDSFAVYTRECVCACAVFEFLWSLCSRMASTII